MLKKIEYENKIAMQNDESIPTKGKVTDDDMNEIKEVVNNNADELENKQPKEEGKGLSEENFTTQLKQKLEDLENFDDKVILQKIENLTKEQTEQNSKISILEKDSNINKTKVEKLETSDKLQTDDIMLLQQENQQIKIQLEETNNLLPKGKFEGEEVTITDSAEHSFKELTIEGNSYQETNEKMPSPEYPSRIRNVGDNINLFNKDGNVIHSYDSKLEPIETGVKVTLKIVGTSRYCVMKLGGSELLGKKLVAHGNVVISGQNDGIIGIYFGTDNNFTINWITDTGILGKNIKDFNRVLTIPDTFPEGCNSIYIIFYANGISTEAQVGDYVEYRNFKIEEGTQATSYSPYNCGNVNFKISNKNNKLEDYTPNEQQNFTLPLKEGQVLHKGDFLAEDGVHHLRKTVVLDGTENWSKSSNLNRYIMDWMSNSEAPVLGGVEVLCTHYKKTNDITKEGIFLNNGDPNINYKILGIVDNTKQTLEEWKSYLAEEKAKGTPVTVKYKLAEPIIEPYTEEQQNVYNQIIKTAKTYKGTTHIFSQDEISPVFKGEYFKDLEILLSNQTGGGN